MIEDKTQLTPEKLISFKTEIVCHNFHCFDLKNKGNELIKVKIQILSIQYYTNKIPVFFKQNIIKK